MDKKRLVFLSATLVIAASAQANESLISGDFDRRLEVIQGMVADGNLKLMVATQNTPTPILTEYEGPTEPFGNQDRGEKGGR